MKYVVIDDKTIRNYGVVQVNSEASAIFIYFYWNADHYDNYDFLRS